MKIDQKILPHINSITILMGTFIVYFLTLSKDISIQGDSGEFAVAVYNLGIPHPPGYPTYILLAKIFTIFFSDNNFIFGLNLFSALCSSIASFLLYLILVKLTNKKSLSFIMTLFFSFSLDFWFHSEITEVYTLNILFILLTIYWLEKIRISFSYKKLFGLFLIMGTGIGVHYFYLVLIPFFLLYLIKSIPIEFKSTGVMLLGFLIGASSFVYIPIRAGKFAPLNTFNPNSVTQFVKLVSYPFNGYKPIKKINIHKKRKLPPFKAFLRRVKNTSKDKILMTLSYFEQLRSQFYLLGTGLPLLFLLCLVLFKQKLLKFNKWYWIFGSLFLYTSLGFLLFTGFKANSSLESEMTPHYITSYLFFIFLVTIIISDFFDIAFKYSKFKLVFLSALSILLIFQFLENYKKNNLSENFLGINHAKDIVDTIPKNGILLTSGDNDIHPLMYYQHVLNKRKDIAVINLGSISQDWYYENLVSDYPQLKVNIFKPEGWVSEMVSKNLNTFPIFLGDAASLQILLLNLTTPDKLILENSFYPYKNLYKYFASSSTYEAELSTLFLYSGLALNYSSSLYLRNREQSMLTGYIFKKFMFGKILASNGNLEAAYNEFKLALSYPPMNIELYSLVKTQLNMEIEKLGKRY